MHKSYDRTFLYFFLCATIKKVAVSKCNKKRSANEIEYKKWIEELNTPALLQMQLKPYRTC